MTPTARSLKLLRDQGWMPGVVERRDGAGISHDFLGLWDILALRDGQVLAVQATSYANVNARLNKITADEHAAALAECRKAGWGLEIHGWRKPAPPKRRRWDLRLVDVS